MASATSARKRYCVFGCTELGAYMHGFPHPERCSERFGTWLSIAGGKLKEMDRWKIYKNKKVCDYHFTHDQKVASHRLIYNAVPTINLSGVFSSPALSLQLEHNYCQPGPHEVNLSSTSEETVLSVPPSESVPRIPFSETSKAVNDDKFTTHNILLNQEKDQLEQSESPDPSENDKQILDVSPACKAIPDGADELVECENFCCDEIVSEEQVPLDSSETASVQHDGEFTWQQLNASEVPDDEHSDEDLQCLDMDVTTLECARSDKRALPQTGGAASDAVPAHEGFQCNHCHSDIIGFRYTCVQCADYDLCAACEARRAHAAHYALRVPAPRPQAEIAAVLQAIRDALQRDAIVTRFQALDEMPIKEEKYEIPDAANVVALANMDERQNGLEDPIRVVEGNSDMDKANMISTDLSDYDTDGSMGMESRDIDELENINQQMDSAIEIIQVLETNICANMDENESYINSKLNFDHIDFANEQADPKQMNYSNQIATVDKSIVNFGHRESNAKCTDQKVFFLTQNNVPVQIKDRLQVRLERCNLETLCLNNATTVEMEPLNSKKYRPEHSKAVKKTEFYIAANRQCSNYQCA